MEKKKIVENILKKYNINFTENDLDDIFTDPVVYIFPEKNFKFNPLGHGKKKLKINPKITITNKDLLPITLDEVEKIGNNYILNNLLIFIQTKTSTYKQNFKTLDDYIITNDNKIPCKKCSGFLVTINAQTRGLDEPETIRYICTTNKAHTFSVEEIENK